MTDPRPQAADLEREARATIEAYRAYLDSPAFQHNIDLAVLVKIAGDESVSARERLRAAEVLARLRLEAMAAVAELTGTREQSLDALGIKPGPQSLALTNVSQRIEIVRAKDWRAAAALDEADVVEAEALPAGGVGENGPAAGEGTPDGEDPPA